MQIFDQLTEINLIIYYVPSIFKQGSFLNDNPYNNLLITGRIGCVNVSGTIPPILSFS